jgi:hypothetical protein
VGALSHFLESEGIATTQISLVREHTVALRAPRALWVPFILGRPFGVPNDAPFQRRVLLAALRLLDAPAGAGPLLEDFPDDAPQTVAATDDATFACPVSFGRYATNEREALLQEIDELASWHRLACERRGRTTAGLSGLSASRAASYLVDFIENNETPLYRAELTRGLSLRLACEDIKAYYLEAVNAQPGQQAAQQAHAWFWRDTVAGRVFIKLRTVCLASTDETVKQFGLGNLVPRAILQAQTRDEPAAPRH